MPEEFTCSLCHKTYEKERSDEEAMEEAIDHFGEESMKDAAVVCDDCFKLIMNEE